MLHFIHYCITDGGSDDGADDMLHFIHYCITNGGSDDSADDILQLVQDRITNGGSDVAPPLSAFVADTGNTCLRRPP